MKTARIRTTAFLGIAALTAGLAVFVTCLGLLGIADYSSCVRRPEVGIRKVCGAGDWALVRLLSQGYLAMLAVGSAARAELVTV